MMAVPHMCSHTPFAYCELSVFCSKTLELQLQLQQCLDADVFSPVRPAVTRASCEQALQTLLHRPLNPIVPKKRQDLFLRLPFLQFTVSGFGGFLSCSLQCFVLANPEQMLGHSLTPEGISFSLLQSISLCISPSSLSEPEDTLQVMVGMQIQIHNGSLQSISNIYEDCRSAGLLWRKVEDFRGYLYSCCSVWLISGVANESERS